MSISKRAGDWYISFKYEFQSKPTTKKRSFIGVDVGINALATCSDGTIFANVKAYKQAKKRLTRYQRRIKKKEPDSKNRAKAVKKVADIRADTLHKLTTWLAKNHSTIVIEDLNVSGMLKNHKAAIILEFSGVPIVIVWIIGKSTIFNVYFNRMGGNIFS